MSRLRLSLAGLAILPLLSGCVAALLPLAALGTMGKKQIDRAEAKRELVASGAIDLAMPVGNVTIGPDGEAVDALPSTERKFSGQGGAVDIAESDFDGNASDYIAQFYRPLGSKASPYAGFAAHALKQSARLEAGEGVESVVLIPRVDGRFLIFSEAAEYSKGGYQALIFATDPAEPTSKAVRFGYQPPKGYHLTDAALLDDKSAVLLHRRFTPFGGLSAIVSIAQLQDFQPGKVATSVPIATLKSPLKVDNMEALAVTHDGDQTIVWIASDDNFIALQESLLFKFRLLKGKVSRKKPDPERQNEKAGASPGFSTFESD